LERRAYLGTVSVRPRYKPGRVRDEPACRVDDDHAAADVGRRLTRDPPEVACFAHPPRGTRRDELSLRRGGSLYLGIHAP
jgi:hypothetical protein